MLRAIRVALIGRKTNKTKHLPSSILLYTCVSPSQRIESHQSNRRTIAIEICARVRTFVACRRLAMFIASHLFIQSKQNSNTWPARTYIYAFVWICIRMIQWIKGLRERMCFYCTTFALFACLFVCLFRWFSLTTTKKHHKCVHVMCTKFVLRYSLFFLSVYIHYFFFILAPYSKH